MDKNNLSASYDVDLALKVGVVAAALFNKLVFLSRYTDREDGYCWKTADELEKELGISRKQQEVAIKKLEQAGLIETKNTYIKNTQTKCKHFKVLTDCAKKENLISTKGRNQISTKGRNQISTKGRNQNSTKGRNQISTKGRNLILTKEEDLSLKDNSKEYSDNNNQTGIEGVCLAPNVLKIIDDFCKEQGNYKTKDLLLTWMEIRKSKGANDTEGTIKYNLESLPSMAKESSMSINEYLGYIVRKGWKDLYPVGDNKRSFRMMTGAEAGITWNPEDDIDTSSTKTDCSIPDDILDMFGEDSETGS